MKIRLRISKYKMLGRSLAREVGAALSLFNLLRYVTIPTQQFNSLFVSGIVNLLFSIALFVLS